jgi:hypothetical protein
MNTGARARIGIVGGFGLKLRPFASDNFSARQADHFHLFLRIAAIFFARALARFSAAASLRACVANFFAANAVLGVTVLFRI